MRGGKEEAERENECENAFSSSGHSFGRSEACKLLEMMCKISLVFVLGVEIVQNFHQTFKCYVTSKKLRTIQLQKIHKKNTSNKIVNVRRNSNILMGEKICLNTEQISITRKPKNGL